MEPRYRVLKFRVGIDVYIYVIHNKIALRHPLSSKVGLPLYTDGDKLILQAMGTGLISFNECSREDYLQARAYVSGIYEGEVEAAKRAMDTANKRKMEFDAFISVEDDHGAP